jgi:endonuclease YncB( thermonuclease family)
MIMSLKNVALAVGFFVLGTGLIVHLRNYSSFSSNLSSTSISSIPISEQWEVLSIHDGDTIKAQKDGVVQKMRFCGIDAPELSQPLGKDSKDYLQSLVSLDKPVQISIVGTDRYNRKIAEIFVIADGTEKFINEEMTKSGMAYSYDRYKNCPNQVAMGNGEAIAKSKKLGVWGRDYQTPWDYRKSKRSK